ncbi:hypothetical protein CANARDRAFT_180678, partial [[Candida] arabinofermentans NRRL YB-2248]
VSDYPDGGLRAYSVVLGSFLGLTVDFGLVNSIGTVQSYLNLHQFQSKSTSVTSLIFSIFLFVTYASIIFSGAMFDELGARIPMIIGTVLFCVGFFAAGSCTTIGSFVVAFSLICGLGVGMLAGPLTGAVSHWFLKNRAKAFGLCTLGGSCGGILFPMVLNRLYEKMGFENAMRIVSAISAALLIASTALITERKSIRALDQSTIEEVSGERISLRLFLLKTWSLTKNSVDLSSLKDAKFLFCVLGSSFSELALLCSLTYFASYVTYIGYSETKANTVVTIINTVGIAGRYIPNVFADRIGCYNVMAVMVLFTALTGLCIWLGWSIKTNTISSVYAFAVMYGFFSSSALSLAPSCVGAISPTRDFGKRYGTMSLITGVFILVGLTIGGVIIGHESLETYRNFSIYTGVISLTGFLMFYCSRYCQVGFRFLR